jgi:hypothetical protein
MQNAHVKALIITNYSSLSSLIKLDTVRFSLCSCIKMDLWLVKQSKGVESGIDVLGLTISTVVGPPAEKKGRMKDYQTVVSLQEQLT